MKTVKKRQSYYYQIRESKININSGDGDVYNYSNSKFTNKKEALKEFTKAKKESLRTIKNYELYKNECVEIYLIKDFYLNDDSGSGSFEDYEILKISRIFKNGKIEIR